MRKSTSSREPAIRPESDETAADRFAVEAACIARLAIETCNVGGCLVGWQRPSDSGEARMPADCVYDALLDRL
ncbi:MAG TPA: hypothetical protein VHY56_10860, partial [Candidatus Binataceae bacterium]|nr:hypothetical protein [Candidatus Binataceae bacterium]